MKYSALILLGSLSLLTACGGGGGTSTHSAAPNSSLSVSSQMSSSLSSTSSAVSSLPSSSSSASSHHNTCRDNELSEVFNCIAGTYAVRTYINTLDTFAIAQVVITPEGNISVKGENQSHTYDVQDALEILDVRQETNAQLVVYFSDNQLVLFFDVNGTLKDMELHTDETLWGVSFTPLSISFNDFIQNTNAMMSNGIAGSFNESTRVNAFYRAMPDNESSLTDNQLYLKGVEINDYWTILINQEAKLDKNINYVCGISPSQQVEINLEYQGNLYSSSFGGECVTRLTSYEIIQGTDKVDYIDGELVGILYTENRQESIRLVDTRFRFDVN